MKNIIEKLKKALTKLYARSYGMDYLNKVLLYTAGAICLLQMFVRSRILTAAYFIIFLIYLFRFFSTKKYARSEENRKFRKFIKFYKSKWDNRKTHKIFRCKSCGQLIRVPKKQGKIEVTCPNCGKKEIHRT